MYRLTMNKAEARMILIYLENKLRQLEWNESKRLRLSIPEVETVDKIFSKYSYSSFLWSFPLVKNAYDNQIKEARADG